MKATQHPYTAYKSMADKLTADIRHEGGKGKAAPMFCLRHADAEIYSVHLVLGPAIDTTFG